jgi:hypothetical protein
VFDRLYKKQMDNDLAAIAFRCLAGTGITDSAYSHLCDDTLTVHASVHILAIKVMRRTLNKATTQKKSSRNRNHKVA